MTFVVLLGELGHVWSTSEVSLLGECKSLVKEGVSLFVVAPLAAAWGSVDWAKGLIGMRARKGAWEFRGDNAGRSFFLQHGWRITLWRIVQQLMGW